MDNRHWSTIVDRVSEQMERAKALTREVAAKDAEIAELIAQLDSARHNAKAADSFRAAYLRERDEALEQLTEARECVRSLYGELMAAVNAGRIDIESNDPFWRSVIAALAATPEHLRNA